MKSSTVILPGIRSVGFTDCEGLPSNVALRSIARMDVPLLVAVETVDFFGEPQCECRTERDGAEVTQSATLKFRTSAELPSWRRLAFVVEDVSGRKFLIGAHERPYPQVNVTASTGLPSGDAAGFEVEVTHKAIRTLIPLIP